MAPQENGDRRAVRPEVTSSPNEGTLMEDIEITVLAFWSLIERAKRPHKLTENQPPRN